LLAYDAENRLLTANNAGGTVAVGYDYDPLGRRTHKSGTGVTEAYYLNDGDDEIVEYDGSKNVVALYVPGPAIDEPIVMVTPNGASYTHKYFHTNHQGSVIAMSDDAGAVAEGPYKYDPYGNCFSGSNPCSAGVPYRFTGRRLDPETGLLYYRARYYSPVLGRFLQTDPVGYTADLNLYSYVGNDPTNRTDPTGATAIITRNDTQIHIVIPILPDTDVSDTAIQQIRGSIERVWTGTFGKYNVTITVDVQRNENALIKNYGVYNSLHTSGLPAPCNGHSCNQNRPTNGPGGADIFINMKDLQESGYGPGEASKGADTPAHECGRCMGWSMLRVCQAKT
jgi:RHS repeat-associated protein